MALDFTAHFSLTSSPLISITDASTNESGGFWFTIKHPDGVLQSYGSELTPAIVSSGGNYGVTAHLDTDGEIQQGTYQIVYYGQSGSINRVVDLDIAPPTLQLTIDLNSFAPYAIVSDSTVYVVDGFTENRKATQWSMDIVDYIDNTGYSQLGGGELNLAQFSGGLRDSNYDVTLSALLDYQNTANPWLLVSFELDYNEVFSVIKPPSFSEMSDYIQSLKDLMDEYDKHTDVYEYRFKDFRKAVTLEHQLANLISHNYDQGKAIRIVMDFLNIIYNDTYIHEFTGDILENYNTSHLVATDFTSLTNIPSALQDIIDSGSSSSGDKYFLHAQGVAGDTWLIQHNLDKMPSVVFVDSDGDVFWTDFDYTDANTITANLSQPTTGYAYCN